MTAKLHIARMIGLSYCSLNDPMYEELLKVIYDYSYRTILKVPANIFIIGIVQSFKLNDLQHANRILNLLKEVVQEALEQSGVELTFTDTDWKELTLIENPPKNKFSDIYLLSKNGEGDRAVKTYMSQYFEV